MTLSMVVAVSVNGVIGRDGDLPWRLSGDLKWFKRVTMGKPIIMGRKTYDSIGRPLPGRTNIVVTRAADFAAEGVITALSVMDAMRIGEEAAAAGKVDEVCIIGGAEIYRLFSAHADRLYLTIVHAHIEGDVSFPTLDWREWRGQPQMSISPDAKNDYAATMLMLDRIHTDK